MRRRLRVDPRYEPTFHLGSAAFDVLGPVIRHISSAWSAWPDVSRYDSWAEPLRRLAGRPLAFREIQKPLIAAAGGYDAFIAETGVIPTRGQSWHDFFNAVIWGRFPHMKLTISRRQLEENRARPRAQRTRLQDWLTHFDECGVVVVSDRQDILQAIRELAWGELFVECREELVRHTRVWCFGHAILEAMREPYVGLVGKALLCHDPGFSPGTPSEELLTMADRWLETVVAAPQQPRLHALPVLGLPGWHANNEQPSFYDQPQYFRARRGALTQPSTRSKIRPGGDSIVG
jgi:hypothetical protein